MSMMTVGYRMSLTTPLQTVIIRIRRKQERMSRKSLERFLSMPMTVGCLTNPRRPLHAVIVRTRHNQGWMTLRSLERLFFKICWTLRHCATAISLAVREVGKSGHWRRKFVAAAWRLYTSRRARKFHCFLVG